MSRRFDALIVGAGVAGTASAILLARCGWKVALVERQTFPRAKVCGECLGGSSFALLDVLGVGAAVRQVAGPELRTVQVLRGADSVQAALPAARSGQAVWSRAVRREDLDTLLLQQAVACGVTLWQPWAVQDVQGRAGDWHCSLRAAGTHDVCTLNADVLIDAHGSWEPLHSVRPQAPVAASQLLAFKAHFQHSHLEPGVLPVLLFEGGYGGMVLGADGVATLACCIRRDTLRAVRSHYPASSAGASVQAMLQQQCVGVQQALQNASRIGPWLAAGPLAPGMHLRADDAVLRVGNAAGEAHPLIGEGMTLALQSAWLLCQTLVAIRSETAATDKNAWQALAAREYAAQWALLLRPRLRTAAVFAQLAMQRLAAPALMALLQRHPALLTRAARWAGKADGWRNFSRSNDDANHPHSNDHPGHPATDSDKGIPTRA
jgi:2-polyprenyl-6-methoxyphenol hydroxylase-like FAD-dependent oxidoreductase